MLTNTDCIFTSKRKMKEFLDTQRAICVMEECSPLTIEQRLWHGDLA